MKTSTRNGLIFAAVFPAPILLGWGLGWLASVTSIGAVFAILVGMVAIGGWLFGRHVIGNDCASASEQEARMTNACTNSDRHKNALAHVLARIENDDASICLFCSGRHDLDNEGRHVGGIRHKEDCPVSIARNALKERDDD